MADARKAALDTALKKIEKNFGKGAIMRMGDAAQTTIFNDFKWIVGLR